MNPPQNLTTLNLDIESTLLVPTTPTNAPTHPFTHNTPHAPFMNAACRQWYPAPGGASWLDTI